MGGKAIRTNVAGGMSGSPSTLTASLVGAVALRFSVFSPDAICGITPIELMLEVNDFDDSRPTDARTPDKVVARESINIPPGMLAQVVSAGSTGQFAAETSAWFPSRPHQFRGVPRKRSARIRTVLPANGDDRRGRWRKQYHDECEASARLAKFASTRRRG